MTNLDSVISDNLKSISKKWFKLTIDSYPAEASSFFGKEKDRFANPVAGTLSESLNKVLTGLISGAGREEIAESLDAAIRVRAVQNFSPSESVAFIFHLKKIICEVAGQSQSENPEFLLLLNKKIDGLALIGFDKYMECREKIFMLRSYELKNTTFKAFERAGLVVDPDTKPEATL